jgi:hypothetical protein
MTATSAAITTARSRRNRASSSDGPASVMTAQATGIATAAPTPRPSATGQFDHWMGA